MQGTLFDIQRFSVHDGPGIRSTVFLKGCPLHCAWCQNPEGLERSVRAWNFDNLCVGCGACMAVCPAGALMLGKNNKPAVDRAACTRCGACVDRCVRNAMALDGFEIDSGDLANRLLNDSVFYGVSGGGVTFSGGEPLMQAAFVGEVAAALRDKGIHTAIETSLAGRWEDVVALVEHIDFFQVDIKIFNGSRHQIATGSDNFRILENFCNLAWTLKGPDRLLVRIPLIPGYTADAANLEAIARFVGEVNPELPVELMNYNPLAAAKYRRMHARYCLAESTKPFNASEMAEMRALVAKHLPRVAAIHA